MSKFEGMEIEVDQASKMIILHPITNLPLADKDGKEAFLMLYSADSLRSRKFDRELTTARLRMRNPRAGIDGDKLEDEAAAKLAVLTADWYLVALDGTPISLACSRGEAEALYGNHRMRWLQEQAAVFVGDRANFSEASSTT